MDDGIVEDEVEENIMQMGATKQPFSLFAYFNLFVGFIESYGWYILIAAIVFYYVYVTYIRRSLSSLTNASVESKLDEDTAIKRIRSMEAARLRQQEALDAAAAKYLEEKRLKEEKLAKERAEEWEKHKQGLGYRNKSKPEQQPSTDLAGLGLSGVNKSNKPKLRGADYNPLTGTSNSNSGDGGSCSWRPTQRGSGRGG